MTSPIKPPSRPPPALDLPAASAPRPGAGSASVGDDFKTALDGSQLGAVGAQSRGPAGAQHLSEVTATRATEVGAALRAGELTPSAAVDALVAEALASADAQRLEPAGKEALEQHLRTMLAEDPSLRDLVSDLSRT